MPGALDITITMARIYAFDGGAVVRCLGKLVGFSLVS